MSTIPSPSFDDDAFALDELRVRQVVPAPRLPYQTPNMNRTRPGWVDRGPPKAPTPKPPIPQRGYLICHQCYVRNDHISPECSLPLRESRKVVSNYEQLTPEEKATVPSEAYDRVKLSLGKVSPMAKPVTTEQSSSPTSSPYVDAVGLTTQVQPDGTPTPTETSLKD